MDNKVRMEKYLYLKEAEVDENAVAEARFLLCSNLNSIMKESKHKTLGNSNLCLYVRFIRIEDCTKVKIAIEHDFLLCHYIMRLNFVGIDAVSEWDNILDMEGIMRRREPCNQAYMAKYGYDYLFIHSKMKKNNHPIKDDANVNGNDMNAQPQTDVNGNYNGIEDGINHQSNNNGNNNGIEKESNK